MSSEPTRSTKPVELAPAWHTGALVALILAVATAGFVLARLGGEGSSGAAPVQKAPAAIATYLQLVAVQLAMAFYVCRIGRSSSAFSALLGRRWDTAGRAFGDLAMALALVLVIETVEVGWARLSGVSASTSSLVMPCTVTDRAAWSVVGLCVGVCEELVYRGYLQTQLAAFTRRPNVAVVLQAALFGVAHLDQGVAGAIRAGLYGLLFGIASRARGSLVPGMVCHAGIDISSGLLRSCA